MEKKFEIDPIWMSKRTWGGSLSLIAAIILMFGYDFNIDLQEQISTLIVSVISSIAGVLSIASKVIQTRKSK